MPHVEATGKEIPSDDLEVFVTVERVRVSKGVVFILDSLRTDGEKNVFLFQVRVGVRAGPSALQESGAFASQTLGTAELRKYIELRPGIAKDSLPRWLRYQSRIYRGGDLHRGKQSMRKPYFRWSCGLELRVRGTQNRWGRRERDVMWKEAKWRSRLLSERGKSGAVS